MDKDKAGPETTGRLKAAEAEQEERRQRAVVEQERRFKEVAARTPRWALSTFRKYIL